MKCEKENMSPFLLKLFSDVVLLDLGLQIEFIIRTIQPFGAMIVREIEEAKEATKRKCHSNIF